MQFHNKLYQSSILPIVMNLVKHFFAIFIVFYIFLVVSCRRGQCQHLGLLCPVVINIHVQVIVHKGMHVGSFIVGSFSSTILT